jgi:hypothetical protein
MFCVILHECPKNNFFVYPSMITSIRVQSVVPSCALVAYSGASGVHLGYVGHAVGKVSLKMLVVLPCIWELTRREYVSDLPTIGLHRCSSLRRMFGMS